MTQSTHLKFNFYPLTIGYDLSAGKLIISLFHICAINHSISGFANQSKPAGLMLIPTGIQDKEKKTGKQDTHSKH
ncbi:hypothetical protein OLMES_3203 [Oleiphilus messinensis]|uniref:Uncharacterized protein n=1 Tax=Oleiphilus messinensis TaxID=141451 RepID=A0A1Y0ICX4_9GAMM|nr:hypothetical protein OLMES_3203 [Oleiphilus messinensis]